MEQDKNPVVLRIEDQQSLIHLGSLDSFDITEGGTDAAKAILSYFDNGKKKELEKAISIYEEIIPNENFGGEYTALEWLCRFFLAPEPAQKDLLAQPFTKAFYEMMSQDDFKNLKLYLQYKYHIKEYGPGDNTEIKAQMRFLEDFIGDHEKIQDMEDVKLIGHITNQSLGHILVTRDDQEFELKAQGWNPL